MQRKTDWRAALKEAVCERMNTPFSYGSHDCCYAAADCVKAITGTDLMVDYRGKYRSAAGAARALKSIGKGTLLKTLISLVPQYGGKRIAVASAHKGDLVVTNKALHDAVQGQAAGIWLDNSAIFPGETGWVHLPRQDLIAAFKIG